MVALTLPKNFGANGFAKAVGAWFFELCDFLQNGFEIIAALSICEQVFNKVL